MKLSQTVSDLGRKLMEWGAQGSQFTSYSGDPGAYFVSDLFGTGLDSGKACDISASPIVSICYEFVARKFVEAKAVMQKSNAEGEWEDDEASPVTLLFNSNPAYDFSHLLAATVVDLLRGNAYWLIARGPTGKPLELWWMPKGYMHVIPAPDGKGGPLAYMTTVNKIEAIWYPEDVIHFRGFRPDPKSFLVGLDPLGPQVPHIRVDNQVAAYTEAIVTNMGVPGAIFTVKDPSKIMSNESAAELKRRYNAGTRGTSRGDAIIIDAPYDVQFPNVSPDNMALDTIGETAEERIPAALMLNAMALQLGAGLKRATFSNYEEAVKTAFDNGIAPLHKIVAETVTRIMVAEFRLDPKRTRFWFDYSDIPALQEDKNEMHLRVREDFKAGGIDRMTFKTKLGYEAEEAKDVDIYATPAKPAGDGLTPEEPVAPATKEKRAAKIELKAAGPDSVLPTYDSDIVHDAVARAIPDMQQLMLARVKGKDEAAE